MRIEYDGLIIVIVDLFEGRWFNSFNDVVVRSDGLIWFIDLFYGIEFDYEGNWVELEFDVCYVFCVDPDGVIWIVVDDFVWLNGLVFLFDECWFYVFDIGVVLLYMCLFVVGDDGTFFGGEVFVTVDY